MSVLISQRSEEMNVRTHVLTVAQHKRDISTYICHFQKCILTFTGQRSIVKLGLMHSIFTAGHDHSYTINWVKKHKCIADMVQNDSPTEEQNAA